MADLLKGIGIGIALFLPLVGFAAIFHGLKVVEINHYHNGEDDING